MGLGFTYLRAHCVSTGEKEVGFTEKEGPGACGPLCCKCLLDPTPLSREWAGLCFPSGHPVAAEKPKGWARFALDCEEIAFHYLLDRSSTGKGPVKPQGALSNGVMRATPPMGWTTPQAEVLPRQEKGDRKRKVS